MSICGVLSVGTDMPSAAIRLRKACDCTTSLSCLLRYDDWRGSFGGCCEAYEATVIEIWKAQFLHSRHLRPRRNPPRTCDGECAYLTVVGERLGLCIERELALHSARCYIPSCLTGTVERNPRNCGLGQRIELG